MLYIMRQLFVLSTLIILTFSVTDISLVNCPSQYNLTQANITQNGSQQIVDFVYSGLASQQDIQRIQNIILTGDYDDLDSFLQQKLMIYVIIAGVFLGVFLVTVFYCLFDKNWPPCERFRRNPLTDPYTTTQRRCMFIWLLIICIGIFTTGIISFTSIPKMKTYVDYTKCSLYNMLDLTLNGDTNTGWGGMQDLKYKIGNISLLLQPASSQVSTYFTNDQWLIDDMTIMKNINMEIYNQNKDSQFITPNPTTTATNLDNGFGYPLIDSIFIKTGMGPNGTFGTMVDDIDRGLRTTQVKSRQAYSIYQSANKMVQAAETIQENAIAAQNTLSMYIRQLQVLNQQMDQFSTRYFDNDFSLFAYILQGVIGFVVVSSLLILLGAFSTHCFQILQCRYMVHCGWFIYGLMYAGVLALAFIAFSHGTVAYQFCQYLNSSIYNQSSYSKIGEKYSQNAMNRLDVCILGDGNSLKKFNIHQQMNTVTQIFTNYQQYMQYDDSSSVNFVDLDISLSKIYGWIQAIEKYRLGVYIDSRPQQTNDDNPNYAIQILNGFTNPSLGGCSKDRWVFDKQNCTDTNQLIYSATSSDANGISLSTTQVICISFNEKFTTAMDDPWSHADFTRRYVQIRQTCPTIYDSIIEYGQTLINYRDSRISLYQGIKDDLERLYNLNSDFNDVLDSFTVRVNQFYESVGTLDNFITNQINGLLVSADCSTLGDQIKVTYNTFCVNFMSQIAIVAICIIVLLVCIFLGVLLGSIFGVRHATIQMLKRINNEAQQVQSSSSRQSSKMKFDKEIMFSEQSHSSEQDQKVKKTKKKK